MHLKNSIFNRTLAGWFILFLAAIPVAVQAKLQTTVVDGQYDEWDLSRDCFPPIHVHDNRVEGLSNVYLRYDRDTNTVFVLVLQADGATKLETEAVASMHSALRQAHLSGNTEDKIINPNYSWVMDGDTRIGWEGSFLIDSGEYDRTAELHVNHDLVKRSPTDKQKTASEVKVFDSKDLFLDCE